MHAMLLSPRNTGGYVPPGATRTVRRNLKRAERQDLLRTIWTEVAA